MRKAAEPLLFPFLCLACGVIAARYAPSIAVHECFIAAAVLIGIAALCHLLRYRCAKYLAFASALTFAGGASALLHRGARPPSLSVPDNVPAILSGCVVEPSLNFAGRDRLTVELAPGARAQVTLYAKDQGRELPSVPYGVPVEFTGKVRTPHNFNNPGSFDSVHYLARRSIYWTASADAATLHVLAGQCGNAASRFLFSLRSHALDRIEALFAKDPYANGMMQAILIGVTARLDRIWTEDYRSTGTFHALVISGSHVALLAAVLLFFLRICAVPRGIALGLTIAAAWLYAGVTGWQAPVLRSAAGMTLYGAARIFYREGRLLNILAAVALLFVIADPEQLLEASFQLSFLAVALIGQFAVPAIEATSGPLGRALADVPYVRKDIRLEPRAAQFRVELRLLAMTLRDTTPLPFRASLWLVSALARVFLFIWEVFLTTFFIQIGLALPMVIYFHRLSASGLSANAVIVPVLSAVVPLGFVAILFGSNALAAVCGYLLQIARIAVSWHAKWEPWWRIPAPPLWLAGAFLLALVAAAYCVRKSRTSIPAFAIAGACLIAIVLHPFAPAVDRGEFELDVLDVGQGDSLLAAFPDGRLMLIDAGGIPSFGRTEKSSVDIGEDVVSPYLWTRSIRFLDVVAMTHAHRDHMGGMSAVLRNFHPRELWTGAVVDSPEWEEVRKTASDLNITIRHMQRQPPFAWGGATIGILAPAADYRPREKPSNDDSLVMRVAYGANSFLLTGDMEKHVEEQLAYEALLRHADVLKVGHHGSRTSSTSILLDAVKPVFGVISVGYENSYGHPHEGTMHALAGHHITTRRTDEQGLVRIVSDGRRITFPD